MDALRDPKIRDRFELVAQLRRAAAESAKDDLVAVFVEIGSHLTVVRGDARRIRLVADELERRWTS